MIRIIYKYAATSIVYVDSSSSKTTCFYDYCNNAILWSPSEITFIDTVAKVLDEKISLGVYMILTIPLSKWLLLSLMRLKVSVN